jgi:hypothetical protein
LKDNLINEIISIASDAGVPSHRDGARLKAINTLCDEYVHGGDPIYRFKTEVVKALKDSIEHWTVMPTYLDVYEKHVDLNGIPIYMVQEHKPISENCGMCKLFKHDCHIDPCRTIPCPLKGGAEFGCDKHSVYWYALNALQNSNEHEFLKQRDLMIEQLNDILEKLEDQL